MAGRPKKDAERFFYDLFYDMPVESQATALRILEEHHEYVKKQARKGKTKGDAPEPVTVADGAAQA